MQRLIFACLVAILISSTSAGVAMAEGITQDGGDVSARAEGGRNDPTGSDRPKPAEATEAQGDFDGAIASASNTNSHAQDRAKGAETKLRQQVTDYQQEMDRWRTCMSQNRQPVVAGDAAPFCTQPIPPDFVTEVPGTLVTDAAAAVQRGPQIILTPEQVAYIEFARLHLEPLKPVIGP